MLIASERVRGDHPNEYTSQRKNAISIVSSGDGEN